MQAKGSGLPELQASLEAERRQHAPAAQSHDVPQGAALTAANTAVAQTGPNAWTRGAQAARAARQATQARRPPEGMIMKVSIPDDGYSKELHQQTVKVTMTGEGWPALRNDDVIRALADRGVDTKGIQTAWKGSNMRYLNLTFTSEEDAKKATDLGNFKLGDVTLTVTGRETATDIKVHWVPGWIRDEFIKTCLQKYGTILSYRAETATVDGVRVFTGSKIIRLKTTPDVEATIPVAIEVSGPVTIRLLVTVRGRPPMCLNCFKLGHKQRDCPPEDTNNATDSNNDNKDDREKEDGETECDEEDKGSGDDASEDEDDNDEMEVATDTEPPHSTESHREGTQGAVRPPPPPPPLQDSPGSPELLVEAPLVIDTSTIPLEPQDTNESTDDVSIPSPASTVTPAPTPTPPMLVDVEHPPWNTTPATPSPSIQPCQPSPATSETFLPTYINPGPDRARSGSRGRNRQTTNATPYARPESDRPRRDSDRFRQTSTYQEAASRAEESMSRFLAGKNTGTTKKKDNTKNAAPKHDDFRPWEKPDWDTQERPLPSKEQPRSFCNPWNEPLEGFITIKDQLGQHHGNVARPYFKREIGMDPPDVDFIILDSNHPWLLRKYEEMNREQKRREARQRQRYNKHH